MRLLFLLFFYVLLSTFCVRERLEVGHLVVLRPLISVLSKPALPSRVYAHVNSWARDSCDVVQCFKGTTKGEGSWRGGCGGGNPVPGYQVLQALGGAASGYDYKFEGRDGRYGI